jgi:PDZ domain-containing protein
VRTRTIGVPGSSQPLLGIDASSEARFRKLPRRVTIDAGRVGGPSAGLAFTLEVLDRVGRDVDRGRRVAVTGTIDTDGCVGGIGGVKQKTIGARKAGADVFVVPAGDNTTEARRYAAGLRILPVKTFQQALRVLATR